MGTNTLPLVVDLDGTLIKTDLLIESFLELVASKPWLIVAMFWWLLRGKAALKAEIAKRVELDIAVLPYNEPLLDYLREQRRAGRHLALATASNHKFAEQVAAHLGLFDEIFASDDKRNMAATNKAHSLSERYGEKQFVYAGNARPDIKVWRHAAGSIFVGHSSQLRARAEQQAPLEASFSASRVSIRLIIKACRVHQWVKNVLIFAPMVAAQQLLNPDLLVKGVLAFFAFSLCASSVYLLNDLLDLSSDRHHKTKCKRPFAAGDLPGLLGIMMIPLLLMVVALICFMLPLEFTIVLVIYYIATTAYSFQLKKRMMLDVVVLAGLYTVRLVAGSEATGIMLSQWLMAFSMFVFLSLALVKRYTELRGLRESGETKAVKGRGYDVEDIELLSSLGAASGYLSVLVLALYLASPDVIALYSHSLFLWGICPLMLYWISRVWIIAHRGLMNDDPIVFAIKDRTSQITAICMAIVIYFAI